MPSHLVVTAGFATGLQARGRFKSDYYSDDEDAPAANPARANGAVSPRPSQAPAKQAAKTGGKAGAKKDPAAERRARLLSEEAEVIKNLGSYLGTCFAASCMLVFMHYTCC